MAYYPQQYQPQQQMYGSNYGNFQQYPQQYQSNTQSFQQFQSPYSSNMGIVNAGIPGKFVNDFTEIMPNEIPMDGSGAIFVKKDLTEINVRSWMADGTISNIVFKAVNVNEAVKTAPEKQKFDLSEESTNFFMQKFDELSEKIDKFAKPNRKVKEGADEQC